MALGVMARLDRTPCITVAGRCARPAASRLCARERNRDRVVQVGAGGAISFDDVAVVPHRRTETPVVDINWRSMPTPFEMPIVAA